MRGFLWTTKHKKHHSDWLNCIDHSFLQLLNPFLHLCFSHLVFSVSLHFSSSSSPSPLKGVWADVDGEPEGGAGLVAALVAEQRVD